MLYFITRHIRKGVPKKSYIIIHGAHHKAGTRWYGRILKAIAREFGWNFEIGRINKNFPEPDTDIFHHWHSNFDFSALEKYRGTHLVRDPRDMVISGYFYHLWCNEKWCKRPLAEFDGRNYQEVLNQFSQEDGIQFEMSCNYGLFQRTAKSMAEWNYDDPDIMELRLEELSEKPELFDEIFEFYGFYGREKKIALRVADENTFEKITGRKTGTLNQYHHFRKGLPGEWRNYFTSSHKAWFKEHYQGLLEKLGYEQDSKW